MSAPMGNTKKRLGNIHGKRSLIYNSQSENLAADGDVKISPRRQNVFMSLWNAYDGF